MLYPKAKVKLLPESASQPSIRPTQVILHSAANDFHAHGTDRYFRESSNLESHFMGLMAPDRAGADGEIWQWIDTAVRADANYHANKRPDGSGAISIETDSASRDSELGPWSPALVESLIDLIVWCCRTHNIPARLCRSPTDPGIGYHTLFGAPSEWTPVSKICPGPDRIRQARDVIIPTVARRLAGKDDIVTPEDRKAIVDGVVAALAANQDGVLDKLATEVVRAPINAHGTTIGLALQDGPQATVDLLMAKDLGHAGGGDTFEKAVQDAGRAASKILADPPPSPGN